MIINPEHIDSYIAQKGYTPLISDRDWQIIVERILDLYGNELWFRCQLITQQYDAFRRFSKVFPNELAQPYRHIRCLDILLSPSTLLDELRDWLNSNNYKNEYEIKPPSSCGTLRIVGYEVLEST